MVSPGNRNHSWLDLGLAKYASLMEVETNEGETEFADLLAGVQVDALTYDEIPLLQAGRLPDFSNEFYALAGSKGAMVFHMLRWKIGDEAFVKTLGQFMAEKAWQSATTDDLVAVAGGGHGRESAALLHPVDREYGYARVLPGVHHFPARRRQGFPHHGQGHPRHGYL